MTRAEELTWRAKIAAARQDSIDPAVREAGLRDERNLLEITESLGEHPEGYDGPCMCADCRCYAG